jgi:hypothetical protein
VSLAEKLSELAPSAPGLPCGIARILQKLQGDDRVALETIANTHYVSGGVSNRQLHEILLGEGYDIAFSSIRLHRSKVCRCFVGKNSEIRVAAQKASK